MHAPRKDAVSHFDIVDNSPAQPGAQTKKSKPVEEEDEYWAFSAPKEQHKIYKTRGDGMGGRGDSDFLTAGDEPKATGKKMFSGSGGMRADNNNTFNQDFYAMTAETNGKKIYKTVRITPIQLMDQTY